MRDAQKPRAERRITAEPADAVERSQKGLLRHVVGGVVANHAGGDTIDDPAMAFDEQLERGQIACGRSSHKIRIGILRQLRKRARRLHVAIIGPEAESRGRKLLCCPPGSRIRPQRAGVAFALSRERVRLLGNSVDLAAPIVTEQLLLLRVALGVRGLVVLTWRIE